MKNPFSILVLLVSLLAACGPVSAPATVSASPTPYFLSTHTPAQTLSKSTTYPATATAFSKNGCIQPMVVGGYRTGGDAPPPAPTPEVLPAGWEMVSTLPEKFIGKYGSYIDLLRPRADHDEIWISVRNNPHDDVDNNYYYYRFDTREWEPAPTPPGFDLFLDGDNNVWASVVSKGKNEPVLYRLDENANEFIPVVDKSNELSNGYIQSLKIGSDGLFWLIFESDTDSSRLLYSFDPVTLVAKRYISGRWYKSFEVDANGDIYIETENTLIYYQPASSKEEQVNLPLDDSIGDPRGLYLDHDDRLWLSDRLWLELSNGFSPFPYIIIRSPIFINYLDFRQEYLWVRPSVLLESIDGRLWYVSNSGQGNAWFQPETGEWCLFTTYEGNIVEDSDHDLWMMIEDTLYRLRLKP